MKEEEEEKVRIAKSYEEVRLLMGPFSVDSLHGVHLCAWTLMAPHKYVF